MRKQILLFFILLVLCAFGSLLLTSCNTQKMAMGMMADALSQSGGAAANVLVSDNDPELVRDALPFMLKALEVILADNPEHPGLLQTTGQLATMYAFAFINLPASMLPAQEYEKQERMYKRSKKMYVRGMDYLKRAMAVLYPDFKGIEEKENYKDIIASFKKENIDTIYWCAMAWLGAMSADAFDLELASTRKIPIEMAFKVYQLDPQYGQGAIDELLISIYASLPADMGGNEKKAREHFDKAMELSNGKSVSACVTLASTISVANQDLEEFEMLLNKALAVNPDHKPENRLVIILNQRKAAWLLENKENFFLISEE